jgi:hypothetical protein
MSKRNVSASEIAVAVVRVSSSGYEAGSMFLFGDEKPPSFARTAAASGLIRYLTSACAAGESLNMTTESPPPTTTPAASPICGNGNTS